MREVMKAPQNHANVFSATVAGAPVDLRAVAQVDPNLAKVCAVDLVQCSINYAKNNDPTDKQKDIYSNVVSTMGINFRPGVPQELKELNKVMANPDVQTMLDKLSPEQRKDAVAPMVAKLEQGIRDHGMLVRDAVDTFNTAVDNTAARAGWRLKLSRSSLTGELVVSYGKTGEQKVRGVGGRDAPASTGMEGSAAFRRATELTSQINRMVDTYAVGASKMVPVGGKPVYTKDVQEQALANILTERTKPLSNAAETVGGDVPRNRRATDAAPLPTSAVTGVDPAAKASKIAETQINLTQLKAERSRPGLRPIQTQALDTEIENQTRILRELNS
jgi:hypothetical protein